MPAVPGVLPVVAVGSPLVGAGALVPLGPVVVTLLLVLARVIRALPGAASGARRAPASRLPAFVGGVFVVFRFLVASDLGAFVAGAVVELPGRRVAAAPRAAVRFGAAGGGVAFAFPVAREQRAKVGLERLLEGYQSSL